MRGAPARPRALPVLCLVLLVVGGCVRPRVAVPALPEISPLEQLDADISAFLDGPGHRRATWGIAVQSLADHHTVYTRNASALLVPASLMKIVTLAVAAEAVGWQYTFVTTVEATGPVVGGVVRGDLVFTGSGDPTLLGRAGEDYGDLVVAALRRRGITAVQGRVVGNDNLVQEPRPGLGWSWDDLGFPFGALAGGLNLEENLIRLVVRPGATEGASTSIALPPAAPDFAVSNASETVRADGETVLWPEWRPGETAPTIAGTIAAGSAPVILGVATGNPTLWFARAIRARLGAAGIEVRGPAVDADDLPEPSAPGITIHEYRSAPLSVMAVPMLEDSINLYAEAILLLATGPSGARESAAAVEAASARIEAWGVPPGAVQIADGSGLSRRNVMAADALAAILERVYGDGASPLVQALPTAGVDGTLANRLTGTPAEGNARAKTGSMSNLRSLAGYVTTRDGEPLVFVIMVNNFEGPAASVTSTIDRIVARLASFSRTNGGNPSPR